jgi:hypothetical protein
MDQIINWKKIIGYETYEVSDAGNVRNSTTGLVLKKEIDIHGYYRISLSKHGKHKSGRIHRLAATAFITNLDNKPCVDHIDNCKTNNHITNLRWATITENNMNAKISKKNTSGVKGVSYDKCRKKWRASIRIDGIAINIGSYATLEEAKQARIKKANAVFGSYTNACEKE